MTKRLLLLVLIIIFSTFISIAVSAENINQELYSGKQFRNPFIEYEEPAAEKEEKIKNNEVNSPEEKKTINNNQKQSSDRPQRTTQDFKKSIPFSLNGIISSQNNKVALLNTGTKVEVVQKNYEYRGYRIIAVEKTSIIVENNVFKFRLKMGGKIDEI